MYSSLLLNKTQYNKAKKRLDEIFFAKPSTPKGKEAALLTLLIEDYEKKNHPIALPHPIEAIKVRMKEKDYTTVQLAHKIGYTYHSLRNVLARIQRISLKMARGLSTELDLPMEVLIQSYELKYRDNAGSN